MDETQCSGDENTCGGDLKGVCGAADRSAVYDTFLADLSSCSISKKCSFKYTHRIILLGCYLVPLQQSVLTRIVTFKCMSMSFPKL